jgi:hypothetical protein
MNRQILPIESFEVPPYRSSPLFDPTARTA